jgi:hypothetical protein
LLKPSKESDPFEYAIAKTRRDAVVTVMLACMMASMSIDGKNQAGPLQPSHGPGWIRHVGPLMNLIRRQSANAEREHEDRKPKPYGIVDRDPKDRQQKGNPYQGRIAIGIHEGAFDKRGGGHMVDSEGFEKSWANPRHRFASPSVSKPVNAAAHKIRRNPA